MLKNKTSLKYNLHNEIRILDNFLTIEKWEVDLCCIEKPYDLFYSSNVFFILQLINCKCNISTPKHLDMIYKLNFSTKLSFLKNQNGSKLTTKI